MGHDLTNCLCEQNFMCSDTYLLVLTVILINFLPSKIFLKATSTFVESNAEVSIKDNSFRSEKIKKVNLQFKMP